MGITRFREKLKGIWHIITDNEYVILTVTIKNNKRTRCAALISDNASKTFIDAAIKFLQIEKKNDCR